MIMSYELRGYDHGMPGRIKEAYNNFPRTAELLAQIRTGDIRVPNR
jgi:hypothetical protein